MLALWVVKSAIDGVYAATAMITVLDIVAALLAYRLWKRIHDLRRGADPCDTA